MGAGISVESRIEQVTVYASGARVRRIATVRAPLPARVRFVGLPLGVIDDTVRCEVEGGAVATAVRAGVDAPPDDARAEESPELRAARRRLALADAEVARLGGALERLEQAGVVEDDPSDEPAAAWGDVLAARRALVSLRSARGLAIREQLAAARREHDDAIRAAEVAAERDARAGSAKAARLHELRKYIELDLATRTAAGDVVIAVEYQVAAARWAPSYVARLEGDAARFELRAVVAQASGEDWTRVALRLSTAEPEQFTALPELHAQKIGRRQHEPARRGFRPPPAGAEALYADYDLGFPPQAEPIVASAVFDDSTYEGRAPQPPARAKKAKGGKTVTLGAPASTLEAENWDEGTSRSKEMYAGAPPPSLPPMQPMAAKSRSGSIAGAVAGVVAAPFALAAQGFAKNDAPGGGAIEQRPLSAAPTPRLDYGNLRMAPARSPARGKLVAAPSVDPGEQAARVADAIDELEELALPPGHVAEWAHTYDYAFASDGAIDVVSDGAWHSIALTSRPGKAAMRHVAVPREQADVFRVAAITNPFDGPLLPGPIDVYDRGQFLVTSAVDYTPPGGKVDVGLGVDPTVKIARNAQFHEEATGMLRGALRLVHAVTIDVENLSARALELEVRERIPVTRDGDDDVEVTLGKVEPAWERWTPDADAPRDGRLRGGYRWRLAIAPQAKKVLRATYEIKIAGKHELVGGNRREP